MTTFMNQHQTTGEHIHAPVEGTFFGSTPKDLRVAPLSASDLDLLDAIDTTTSEGKFQKVQLACRFAIERYTIAQLENQHDDAFIEHLDRLVRAEIDFENGMARYLGITSVEGSVDPL